MRIVIAADHGGFELKSAIREHLLAAGHEVEDRGVMDATAVDYPELAGPVARDVAAGRFDRGVLVCGTGQGMAMAANKVAGVRAAVVAEPFSARMAAEHNDARILCLGGRVVGPGVALACVDAWLAGTFAGGRHARRVAAVEALLG